METTTYYTINGQFDSLQNKVLFGKLYSMSDLKENVTFGLHVEIY